VFPVVVVPLGICLQNAHTKLPDPNVEFVSHAVPGGQGMPYEHFGAIGGSVGDTFNAQHVYEEPPSEGQIRTDSSLMKVDDVQADIALHVPTRPVACVQVRPLTGVCVGVGVGVPGTTPGVAGLEPAVFGTQHP
jgi:hypothetical protein